MKKLMFLLMVAFAAMSASAQITWNAKAGLGVAHCWGDADDMSSHFVGKIGAGIETPLTSDWSLMPSLEIAWKGAKENWEEYGEKGEGTIDLLYLQIPVLAAYRLNINDSWNMTLKAGPYFALGVYGNMKYKEKGYSDSWDVFKKSEGWDGGNRFDVGLDLGIDFEYHRFVFGAEYELGFISIQKTGDGLGSLRNAAFYATVGYKF